MTNRTGQDAIQALASAGGIRETSAATPVGTAVKFNPGWGLADQSPYSGLDTALRPTQISLINDLGSVAGCDHFLMAFYWGGLQTGPSGNPASYKWDVLDAALSLCQSKGLRLHVVVQWSAQTSRTPDSAISVGIFPAYLRDTFTGIHQSSSGGRCSADVFREDIMDEYLALHQAMVDHGLNNHAWFEGAHTYDSSQQMSPAPGYSLTAYRDQLVRMCQVFPTIWTKTGAFVSIDGGLGGDANIQMVVQSAVSNRCIVSGIDLLPIEFTAFTTDGVTGGTPAMRVYQGIDGTVDFRPLAAWGGRMSPNNLGDAGLPSAAQYAPTQVLNTLLYGIVKNDLQARYCFLPWKLTGFGTTAKALANNQFYNVAPTPPPTYTLYHPTIREFLVSAGSFPLNSTKPANYGAVVTGGT